MCDYEDRRNKRELFKPSNEEEKHNNCGFDGCKKCSDDLFFSFDKDNTTKVGTIPLVMYIMNANKLTKEHVIDFKNGKLTLIVDEDSNLIKAIWNE